jgi:hypothetical protein
MNEPRMQRGRIPLPEVKELDAHGNEIVTEKPKYRNQWEEQLYRQLNQPAKENVYGTVVGSAATKREQVEYYEWPSDCI